MKIKLIKPDGVQEVIEADYYEYSQGKYENEDIVLVFYKKEEVVEEEDKTKPLTTGVVEDTKEFKEDLNNVLGPEILGKKRKENNIKFTDSNLHWLGKKTEIRVIETSSHHVDFSNALNKALDELIKKEKELNTLLKQIENPIILVDNNRFIIKESVEFEYQE